MISQQQDHHNQKMKGSRRRLNIDLMISKQTGAYKSQSKISLISKTLSSRRKINDGMETTWKGKRPSDTSTELSSSSEFLSETEKNRV